MTDLVPAPAPGLAVPLTDLERRYALASKAPNTQRAYRSALAGFGAWCQDHGLTDLPADPSTVSQYITELSAAGATRSTVAVHLAAISAAHRGRGHNDPVADQRVRTMRSGISRTDLRPQRKAKALRLTTLTRIVAACPTVYTRKGKPDEPSLAGARDRALLLVMFATAMRRSEICALELEDLADHDRGRVITIRHSKTDQTAAGQPVVLPRGAFPDTCPVRALDTWLALAGITSGPVFRKVTTGNRPSPTGLSPDSMNRLLQAAFRRAGLDPAGYSAHSTRAGHITEADRNGVPLTRIAQQSRHKSLKVLAGYVRANTVWDGNSALQLGL